MKHARKLASLLLALVMVFALAVTAFAADITVIGAKNGETYTAYKIFDVTMDATEKNYAYTIAANSEWKSVIEDYKVDSKTVFTLTPSASDANTLLVTYEGEIDGATLATYLDANKSGKTPARTVVAADDTASFTGLETGYYFVDTTLGSLCSLFTTNAAAKLEEKNTIPSIDKQQSDDALQIGEDVTFTITVTDSKGTDAAITVHDTMSEGLTLKENSFEIKVDETDVDATNYTINTTPDDGCTFEIVFNADYVKSLAEGKKIVITYKATLNKNATISGEGNTNTTWLNYSKQETEKKQTKLSSYKFDVDKVDGSNNALAGAKFKLYAAEIGGTAIKVVGTAGNYRVADTTETATAIEEMETDSHGQLTITGLDKKTYYLEETAAPAGYNKLTERQEVDLSKGDILRDQDASGVKTYGVKIVNQSGTELPSTGGTGTTIFYVLGFILVIGAAVLLVTKKRMSNANR